MACKGTCKKYKKFKPSNYSTGRYAVGQKRCSICEIFIEWDGNNCPCCNCNLRTKPRNSPNRHNLQKFNMIKRM